MDFNQICISNSPMYALPVNQLSAKSKQLNLFKKYSNYSALKIILHINIVCVSKILCKSFVCGPCYESNQPTVTLIKSSDMLNKNTLGVKKCEIRQKQHCGYSYVHVTKIFGIN